MQGIIRKTEASLRNRQAHEGQWVECAKRYCSQTVGYSVAGLGLIVLIAWLAEYPELRGIRTGWPAMKFNTALSFVLIGLALARPTISIGYVAAGLGMLLAGLTLLEYLLGINLTIDDLIVRDTSGVSAAFPGRIPLSATIMFLLLYIAMVFKTAGWWILANLLMVLLVLSVALLDFNQAAFQQGSLLDRAGLSSLAPHTTIPFLLLSAVLLYRILGTSVARSIHDQKVGIRFWRGLMSFAVVIPVLAGCLLSMAVAREQIPAGMVIWLYSLLSLILIVSLLSIAAWIIGQFEQERLLIESYLVNVFHSSRVPTLVVEDGKVVVSNQVAQQIFGYTESELMNLPVEQLVPHELREKHVDLRKEYSQAPLQRSMGMNRILKACRKDGSQFSAEIGLHPAIGSTGNRQFIVSIIDRTERDWADYLIRANEQRLSLVLQATHDAVWDYDLVEGTVLWSAVASELMGYDRSDTVMTWHWRQARIHAEDRQRVQDSFDAVLKAGQETWSCEYRLIRDNGEELHILDRARIAKNREGEPIRAVGAMRDQTADKEAARQLLERQSWAQTMTDQAPMLMWLASLEGDVLYANQTWQEFTGIPRDSALGSGWLRTVHVDDRERVLQAFADARIKLDAFVIQFRLVDTTGEYRWILWHTIPWQGPTGEVGAYLGCGVDIDNMKHSHDELLRSNAELQHFAYVASHDLQEPLRMVSSFCGLLKTRYSERLDDDGREFIDFAVEGASRMQQLIEDLLLYSRVGKADLKYSQIDAGLACDQAIRALTLRIEETGATVRRESLPVVRANESQLSMVFQNLIGNAIKFHGDAPPNVEVTAEAEREYWKFKVRDNGLGIEARHQNRIFQLFQRLHTREEFSGSGIGLAVCRKIVEAHGGEIGVTSEPGRGSTFYFRLPRIVEQESDTHGQSASSAQIPTDMESSPRDENLSTR
jgi:PAS domain S-box-containing protein